MKSFSDQPTSRRKFLQHSGAAVLGGALAPNLLFPGKSFAANSDTLKVGLIGCGGRGTGAARQALTADSNAILTAMGDAFDDRLQQSHSALKASDVADRVQVDPANRFTGFDACQQVVNSGVDVVLLCTPPAFRPAHLRAAVMAGKHVFCEKPACTDAPGYRTVIEAVEESKRRKLAIVAGFCWRYNLGERAGFARVLEGDIGDIRAIYSTYNTGGLWSRARQPGWTDLEWQLRNWLYFTWLSGDHLVEQAVHSVDKVAWAKNDVMPVKAIAHGGRQVRTEPVHGHIYDHFSIVYDWEDGTKGFLFCRQQPGCANDNSDTIMGTTGVCRIPGLGGPPFITGANRWRYGGERPNMYQVQHDELFASIRDGNPINDGQWLANSSMMAILGRMAAYTGQEITWEQAINSEERLVPETLEWDMPLPVPPVAMPGKTPFV